jgi:ribose transport system substrate-binding protein
LKHVAAGAGLALPALWVGCRQKDAEVFQPGGGPRRLRAAFSSAGLTASWNQLGRQAAMLWGRLLDVEVQWLDGESDPQKQRQKIESICDQPWDFCALQACQIGVLEEPVKRLKERGVPVISMDTLLAERDRLREAGVWLHIAANHVYMAESSTQYLVSKINEEGKLIHVGGEPSQTTSQSLEQGFNNIVSHYPDVDVIGGGVQWCDWDPKRARHAFEALLKQSEEPIAGAFFHSDDMALACVPALNGSRHAGMVITAVDGQEAGLTAVRDGKLAATVVNPTSMIHGWSLTIGQFIVRNDEKIDDVPLEITCPSPLVAQELGNVDAMLYLADPRHCLV